MRALCVLVCMLLLTRVASAQPANAASAFDAADVHVSARVRNPAVRGGYYAGGRYELSQRNDGRPHPLRVEPER